MNMRLYEGDEAELHFLAPNMVTTNSIAKGYKSKTLKVKIAKVIKFSSWTIWNNVVFMSVDQMKLHMNRYGDYAELSSVFVKLPGTTYNNSMKLESYSNFLTKQSHFLHHLGIICCGRSTS